MSSTSSIAMRYAKALFDICSSQGERSLVIKDFDVICSFVSASSGVRDLFISPVFAVDDQMKAVACLVSSLNVSDPVSRFLGVIIKNRRLSLFDDICSAFKKMDCEARGEVLVEVFSPRALSADHENTLRSRLSVFNIKSIDLRVSVDPSLLGGLVLKIGSRQIDASLRTQLNSLKFSLKEAG